MYRLNLKPINILMGTLAILAGAAVIYAGNKIIGIDLELYYGIQTFNPYWVLTLFLVPFIGGIVVSFIYGLGGKILAYFPALIVHGAGYLYYQMNPGMVPDGTTTLQLGYWILIVIIAVEAAAVGGIVGEVVIKKTYGRSDKRKLHKRYQKRPAASNNT